MESTAILTLKCSSAVTFAGEQNFIPVIQEISLENTGAEPLNEITLTLEVEPDFASAQPIHIDNIAAGARFSTSNIEFSLKQEYLYGLNEAVRGSISIRASKGAVIIAEIREPIEVLAYDQWAGWRQLPELLAAFAQPNHSVVAEVLKDAASKLLRDKSEVLSGYQSHDRQAVARQIAAIYSVLAEREIHYCNPPANFTEQGQKIRLPDRIIREHLGTCLDLAMLMVSCLEQTGLHPLILLEEGHSWAGCWLLDKTLSLPACDDKQSIRKRIDAGELILIETTGFTPQTGCSFSVALRLGQDHLREDNPNRFECAIDVNRARGHRILPLPIRGQEQSMDESLAAKSVPAAAIEEVDLPPLAPEVVIPSSTAKEKPESGRIEQWKSKLLDLSLRNRLLNFKPTKQIIPLYYPDPAVVEELLAEGKTLKIKSLPDLLSGSEIRSNESQNRKDNSSLKEDVAREAFKRAEFLADIPADELDKRLTEIFRSARNALEEGGSNTLYLAVGMLQWTESAESSRAFSAPLILVPTVLERQAVRGGFFLKRHDDDIIVNPSLLQMLSLQFDLQIEGITGATELPMHESGVDVNGIWTRFRKAVVDQPGFEVKPNVYLGIFSFAKYLMWKDLNDRSEELLKSPIVKHLSNQETAKELSGGSFAHERDLDRLKQPHDLFIAADCDSSQLAAVNAAADGLNFVLEGPPGTGKSQTITNIIADTLARGKTVLFVSEKIAALNVVHDRLKKLGLGPFLLELHSSKASKSDVLGQLEQSLAAASQHTVQEWEFEALRLGEVRQKLNEYVDILHKRHENGLSVYDATSLIISKPNWKPCGFPWESAETHSSEDLESLFALSRRIGSVGSIVSGIDPSEFSLIMHRDWSPSWQSDVLGQVKIGIKCLQAVEAASSTIVGVIGLTGFAFKSAELDHLDFLCEALQGISPENVKLLNQNDLTTTVRLLNNLAEHGNARNESAIPIKKDYSEDFFKLNARELLEKWNEAENSGWLKKILSKYRFRNLLKAYNKNHQRPTWAEIPSLLEALAKTNKEDGILRILEDEAQKVLGSNWCGSDTDWNAIFASAAWLQKYVLAVDKICLLGIDQLVSLRTSIMDLAAKAIDSFGPQGRVGILLAAYRSAHSRYKAELSKLAICCGTEFSILAGSTADPQTPESLIRKFSIWINNARILRDWCLWNAVRLEAIDKGLSDFLTALEQKVVPYECVPEYFRYCYTDWWLGKIIDCTPVLGQFTAIEHERIILEFRDRDARFIELTKKYIYAKISSRIPANQLPPPTTPLGILRRELQKKTRHMPVRRLLATISGILPDLSPCLLMSPLSATQYLNAAGKPFDLIIFDEASQIPTWDAVGAIARGKQLIVVGDPKQLPPTNFFNVSNDLEQADEETDIEDLESILDECVGSGLLTHTLKWHYRSRRESLIAFSNYRYYKSALITFPSPVLPDNGIVMHHVKGVYQRSTQRTNRQEADAIIDHIRQHFKSPRTRNQSIGVVTFSQIQQKLIEDLLDAARCNDASLDAHISANVKEPIFIKNLENVQGDERDVILFSICYGPDESGRVFMNFGPLNKNGGHRRLNVAISRAKIQVHIFATLRPENIDLSKTRSVGVADLKLYLEYAIKGPSALLSHAAPTGFLPESLFEIEVLNFLQDKGWIVHPQVGCSSYRIDLAVVDPRVPGRYILAVECDGARYHSAATARDRDKLRQMVLEQLGWRVHRIWSTEWWGNPDREKNRLVTAVQSALDMPFNDGSILKKATKSSKSSVREESIKYASLPIVPDFVLVPKVPKESSQYKKKKMPAYSETKLPKRNRENFFNPEEDAVLMDLIARLITEEGPVSNYTIKRRINKAYGFDRLGPRISDRVDSLLKCQNLITQEKERIFYWPATIDSQVWRDYRIGGDRNLLDISIQELANITEEKLKSIAVGDEASLIRETALFCGVSRIFAQTEERVGEAIAFLKYNGRVENVIGGLRVVPIIG
jgi:very-short-patch-repair endonuclease